MIDTIIDVREYPEYAAGHIKGAKLVPLGTVSQVSLYARVADALKKRGNVLLQRALPRYLFCRVEWTHGRRPASPSM